LNPISTGAFQFRSTDHGYVPAPDGSITEFDAPGAGTGGDTGTGSSGINSGGAVAGLYADSSGNLHGYVRARDGDITDFDPPGSIGTVPYGINPAGVITGEYFDASLVLHGFVRE
jgi:hypothetical protein